MVPDHEQPVSYRYVVSGHAKTVPIAVVEYGTPDPPTY
jgi:hypothetical protein